MNLAQGVQLLRTAQRELDEMIGGVSVVADRADEVKTILGQVHNGLGMEQLRELLGMMHRAQDLANECRNMIAAIHSGIDVAIG